MTKLESADEIIIQNGDCVGISCKECCLTQGVGKYHCGDYTKMQHRVDLARQYKKENIMNRIEVLEKIIRQKGSCHGIDCVDDKCPLSISYGNGACKYCTSHEHNLKMATELLAKEKEMKFKVGDIVRGNGNEKDNDSPYTFTSHVREFLSDGKEREITEVNCSYVRLKGCPACGFNNSWLEKVGVNPTLAEFCELHQMYGTVINSTKCEMWLSKPLKSDANNYWYGGNGIDVSQLVTIPIDWFNRLYIPKSMRPKYEEYTVFNTNWMDKMIFNDDVEYGYIVGFDKIEQKVIVKNNDDFDCYSFKSLLSFTDKNNRPFGKEIK